jgi:Sulfotransferase domain
LSVFGKATSIARKIKVSLIRKRIRDKKRELSRIKTELRAMKDPEAILEHKKRKKGKKQEIFRLKNELRAAKEPAGGEPETGGALPDFVIIGAKKSGTSSLLYLLNQHPDVEPAALKESHYFTGHFDEDIEWYRRCFPAPRWRDGRRTITGESTPGYLFSPLVPERMAEVIPQARLIALLRNPVDRAYSDYQQVAGKGRETRTFEEAMEEAMKAKETPREEDTGGTPYYEYLSRGIYVDQLLHWSKFFDGEQMLVLKSEDFFERPSETLELVLDFLDLPDWEPKTWRVRNPGRYEQEMDPATRHRLEEYFEPHNQRLYEYLGVDLGW